MDNSDQTINNLTDASTNTVNNLTDQSIQAVKNYVDQSTITDTNLLNNSTQTINNLVDAQVQTGDQLLEKYFNDFLLQNETASEYTNISPTDFIEQVRFNPEYTDFFNKLDNMVLNWQSRIQNPMSPSIGRTLSTTSLDSPITNYSADSIVSSTSNTSTETILPILIKAKKELATSTDVYVNLDKFYDTIVQNNNMIFDLVSQNIKIIDQLHRSSMFNNGTCFNEIIPQLSILEQHLLMYQTLISDYHSVEMVLSPVTNFLL